jgi:DNA-binding transcriptional regulator YiaG
MAFATPPILCRFGVLFMFASLSTVYVDNELPTPRQHKMLMRMTPAQCRAARALLGMTQPELAKESGLGLSTVVDFERMRRQVSDDAIEAMQIALRRNGIEIIEENGGGPGVRLRYRSRPRASKP